MSVTKYNVSFHFRNANTDKFWPTLPYFENLLKEELQLLKPSQRRENGFLAAGLRLTESEVFPLIDGSNGKILRFGLFNTLAEAQEFTSKIMNKTATWVYASDTDPKYLNHPGWKAPNIIDSQNWTISNVFGYMLDWCNANAIQMFALAVPLVAEGDSDEQLLAGTKDDDNSVLVYGADFYADLEPLPENTPA